VADENGRLAFREGALVTAVRHGHWVVLDELNLAPSEVLEALNRHAAAARTLPGAPKDHPALPQCSLWP
jgi:midasin (ATPase involved in ribosome maturation)